MKLLINQVTREESAQVLVRSKLRAVSRRMNYTDVMRERIELVANELMTNHSKFAKSSGLMQVWEVTAPKPALDLFALDYGPGIAHLPAAMEDGYTTASTMGKGLGAVKRLSHQSEFFTIPENVAPGAPWHGTAVWVRFYREIPKTSPQVEIGSFLRAYQDDVHNGDCIDLDISQNSVKWLHVDGLGHGKPAFEATQGAYGIMAHSDSPVQTMERLSTKLKGTRGAVAIAVELDLKSQQAVVCGVGDMAAYRVGNGEKRAISFSPGVLGYEHRSFEATALDFPKQALLLTASDGIRRSWDLNTYPGLWRLHPQLIALFLGNVAGRMNDDKSLLVVRTKSIKGD